MVSLATCTEDEVADVLFFNETVRHCISLAKHCSDMTLFYISDVVLEKMKEAEQERRATGRLSGTASLCWVRRHVRLARGDCRPPPW